MATRREPEEAFAAHEEEESREAGPDPELSTARLIRGIVAESGKLVVKEIELARVELGEKISLLQRYLTTLVVGGALLVCAFFFLLSALGRGFRSALSLIVDDRIAVWLAPLILAVLLGAAGLWLLARARRMLRTEGLAPEKTLATLRENSTWIKEKLP